MILCLFYLNLTYGFGTQQSVYAISKSQTKDLCEPVNPFSLRNFVVLAFVSSTLQPLFWETVFTEVYEVNPRSFKLMVLNYSLGVDLQETDCFMLGHVLPDLCWIMSPSLKVSATLCVFYHRES